MPILVHSFVPFRAGTASGRTRHLLSASAGQGFAGENQAQAHHQATKDHDNQGSNEGHHKLTPEVIQ
jgi:hypothetical protein